MRDTDVVIVGGAAAGLAAGLFCARRGLKTTLISKDIGGQLSSTHLIENYPGVAATSGYALAASMAEQAKNAGVKFVMDEVTAISLEEESGRPLFAVKGSQQQLLGRALIIALGKTPRSLNVPGERELFGRGVAHAAGVELPRYRGRRIVIVGGGSSAFEAARLAVKLSDSVTLIHRSDIFRAEQAVVEELRRDHRLTCKLFFEVTRISGQERVESITIRSVPAGQEETLPAEAVFIEIGFAVNPSLFKDLVRCDARGHIIVDDYQQTSQKGIFAAGDISSRPYNQVAVSVGEGTTAALAAYTYLTGLPAGADWSGT